MILRLSALLALAGVLAAAEHGIRIQATSPWSDPHGYTPVIVTASATDEVELDVRIDSNAPSARATIRVPEGRQVRQTILIPPSNQSWFSLNQLEWDERSGVRGTVSINSRGHGEARSVLVDPPQEIHLPTLLAALTRITSASHSSGSEWVDRIDPGDLPDRWQGYPDWLVLVLTPKGDTALDEVQRAAITTWVQTGGTLVVTTADLARTWEQHGVAVRHDPLTGEARVLGAAISQHDNHERWAPEAAPVPGTETVPVKTFVVLALAFALAVGPLNLWWVGRRNARHLFLITTPVMSFLTCMVLIVASLLSDGVSVKRSVVQVCYLDHRCQQLVRWTGCTYFASFARSSLDLDPQTKVRVMDPDAYDGSGYSYRRADNNGGILHLDWRQGQLLSGMVLPARLNRQLSYVETLPERRRLVIERDGNGFRVANGLGTAVLSFAWRDGQGGLWLAGTIGVGETAALQSRPGDSSLPLAADPRGALDLSAPLPASIANRIGREVGVVYDRLRNQPSTFTAILAAPMDAVVGPSSLDPKPPVVIAFGPLPLGQGAEAAP